MAARPSVSRGVQLAGAAVAGLVGYEYFEPILDTTTKMVNKVVPALTPAQYDCEETKFLWSALVVPHAPMSLCVQKAITAPEVISEIANSIIEPDNLLTSAPSLHPAILIALLFLFNLFTSMMQPPHRPTFASIVQAIFAMLTALPTYLTVSGGLATVILWLTPTATMIIVPMYEIYKYLKADRDQTKEALDQLRADGQALQASFNDLKEESERQKLKIDELQTSYEHIVGEYYELEGAYNELEGDYYELEEDFYVKEAEHEALKEECNRISASNERKRGRIYSLENEVEKLGLDCESLLEENQQLIEQIDELMGELPGELPGQEGEEEGDDDDDDNDNKDPSQTGEDQVQDQEIGRDEIDIGADDSNQRKTPEHDHHQHHHHHHLDDSCDSPSEAAVAEQGDLEVPAPWTDKSSTELSVQTAAEVWADQRKSLPPSFVPGWVGRAGESVGEGEEGKKAACKFWISGHCKAGQNCQWYHDPAIKPPPTAIKGNNKERRREVCKQWDNCQKETCSFRHISEDQRDEEVAEVEYLKLRRELQTTSLPPTRSSTEAILYHTKKPEPEVENSKQHLLTTLWGRNYAVWTFPRYSEKPEPIVKLPSAS